MNTIGTPLRIPELDLKPEPTGGIQLSDDMQQTLSLLAGFWQNKRVLIKALPSGVLTVCSPEIQDIIHITASGANYNYQGSNIPCAEIMIMGHPDNTDLVWVKTGQAATANNGWPLAKKEILNFTINNLNNMYLLIVANGEKAIILYTK